MFFSMSIQSKEASDLKSFRSEDEATECGSWSELSSADSTVQMPSDDEDDGCWSESESIDADSTVQEPGDELSKGEQPAIGGSTGGLRAVLNVQIRANGVAMDSDLVNSFWRDGRLHLQLACTPKKEKVKEEVKWSRIDQVLGKTQTERLKAAERGGTFNFKIKVLDVVRSTTSIKQPVVLLTCAQRSSRVRLVFWEKHISFFDSLNIVPGDRVQFFDLNLSKYYSGCLEATHFTRAVKYKRA